MPSTAPRGLLENIYLESGAQGRMPFQDFVNNFTQTVNPEDVEEFASELHQSRYANVDRAKFDESIGMNSWRSSMGMGPPKEKQGFVGNVIEGVQERAYDNLANAFSYFDNITDFAGMDTDWAESASNWARERQAAQDYTPTFTWERWKEDPTILNTIGMIIEEGAKSLPEMAAMAVGGGAVAAGARIAGAAIGAATTGYVAMTHAERIAQDRATALGLEEPTPENYALATGVGTGIAMLERVFPGKLGAKIGAAVARDGAANVAKKVAATGTRRIAKATGSGLVTEALTEAIQEGMEYAGGHAGTDKFQIAEMLDAAAAGAVIGGGMGAGIGGGVQASLEAVGKGAPAPEAEEDIANRHQSNIDLAMQAKDGLRRPVVLRDIVDGQKVMVSPIDGEAVQGTAVFGENGMINIVDDDGNGIFSFDSNDETFKAGNPLPGFDFYTLTDDEINPPDAEPTPEEEEETTFLDELNRLIGRALASPNKSSISALKKIANDPIFGTLDEDLKNYVDDIIAQFENQEGTGKLPTVGTETPSLPGTLPEGQRGKTFKQLVEEERRRRGLVVAKDDDTTTDDDQDNTGEPPPPTPPDTPQGDGTGTGAGTDTTTTTTTTVTEDNTETGKRRKVYQSLLDEAEALRKKVQSVEDLPDSAIPDHVDSMLEDIGVRAAEARWEDPDYDPTPEELSVYDKAIQDLTDFIERLKKADTTTTQTGELPETAPPKRIIPDDENVSYAGIGKGRVAVAKPEFVDINSIQPNLATYEGGTDLELYYADENYQAEQGDIAGLAAQEISAAKGRMPSLVVNEKGELVKGMKRLGALKRLGVSKVPIRRTRAMSDLYNIEQAVASSEAKETDVKAVAEAYHRGSGNPDKVKLVDEKGLAEATSVINELKVKNKDRKKLQKALDVISGAVAEERPELVYDPQGDDVVSYDRGKKEIDVEYAIVEAEDLLQSTDEHGKKQAGYPEWKQPRTRGKKESMMTVKSNITNFIPRKLVDKSDAAQSGSPIIDTTGVVESGNGRVSVLKGVYDRAEQGEQKYQDLIKQYKEELKKAGFSVPRMKQPVLVRVRKTDLNKKDLISFISDANTSTVEAVDAATEAMQDARELTDEMVALYQGGDVASQTNADFVKAFLFQIVPNDQLPKYRDDKGDLNQDGIRRIEMALIHKAFDDEQLTRSFFADEYEGLRTLRNVVASIAPKWASFKARINTGNINPVWDITAEMTTTIKKLDGAMRRKLNDSKMLFREEMGGGGMFEQASPLGLHIANMFFPVNDDKGADIRHSYQRMQSAQKTIEKIKMYVTAAEQSSMFYNRGEEGGQLFETPEAEIEEGGEVTVAEVEAVMREISEFSQAQLEEDIRNISPDLFGKTEAEEASVTRYSVIFLAVLKAMGKIADSVEQYFRNMFYGADEDTTTDEAESAIPDNVKNAIDYIMGHTPDPELEKRTPEWKSALDTLMDYIFENGWDFSKYLEGEDLETFTRAWNKANDPSSVKSGKVDTKGLLPTQLWNAVKDLSLPSGSAEQLAINNIYSARLFSKYIENEGYPERGLVQIRGSSIVTGGSYEGGERNWRDLSLKSLKTLEEAYSTVVKQIKVGDSILVNSPSRDINEHIHKDILSNLRKLKLHIAKKEKQEIQASTGVPDTTEKGVPDRLDGRIGDKWKPDEVDYYERKGDLAYEYFKKWGGEQNTAEATAENRKKMVEKAYRETIEEVKKLTFSDLPDIDQNVINYAADSFAALISSRQIVDGVNDIESAPLIQVLRSDEHHGYFEDTEYTRDKLRQLSNKIATARVVNHYMRNFLHSKRKLDRPYLLLAAYGEIASITQAGAPHKNIKFQGEQLPSEIKEVFYASSNEISRSQGYIPSLVGQVTHSTEVRDGIFQIGKHTPDSILDTKAKQNAAKKKTLWALTKYNKGWKPKEVDLKPVEEEKKRKVQKAVTDVEADTLTDFDFSGEFGIAADDPFLESVAQVEEQDLNQDDILNVTGKTTDELLAMQDIAKTKLAYLKKLGDKQKQDAIAAGADPDRARGLTDEEIRIAVRYQNASSTILRELKRRNDIPLDRSLEDKYKVAIRAHEVSREDPETGDITRKVVYRMYNLVASGRAAMRPNGVDGINKVLKGHPKFKWGLIDDTLAQLGGTRVTVAQSPSSNKSGYEFDSNPLENKQLTEALELEKADDMILREYAELTDTEVEDLLVDFQATEHAPEISQEDLPSQAVQAFIRLGEKAGLAKEVIENQIEDIGRVVKAFKEGKRGFVLATQTGSGKTFMLGGAIKQILTENPHLNVLYVSKSQGLHDQIREDLKGLLGAELAKGKKKKTPGGVHLITYAGMLNKVTPKDPDKQPHQDLAENYEAPNLDQWVDENTVIVFDEGHYIANMDTTTNHAAYLFLKKSRFNILSSATPFRNPADSQYLDLLGVFDDMVTEQPEEGGVRSTTGGKGFKPFAMKHGVFFTKTEDQLQARMKELQISDPNHPMVSTRGQWLNILKNRDEMVEFLIDMVKDGVYMSRPPILDKAMTENDFLNVMTDNWHFTYYHNIEKLYDRAKSMGRELGFDARQLSMQQETTLKRIAESGKILPAVETALEERYRLVDIVEWTGRKDQDHKKSNRLKALLNAHHGKNKNEFQWVRGVHALKAEPIGFTPIDEKGMIKQGQVEHQGKKIPNRHWQQIKLITGESITVQFETRQVLIFIETKRERGMGKFKIGSTLKSWRSYDDRDSVTDEQKQEDFKNRNDKTYSWQEVLEYWRWYEATHMMEDGKIDMTHSKFSGSAIALAMEFEKQPALVKDLPGLKEQIKKQLVARGIKDDKVVYYTGDETSTRESDISKQRFLDGDADFIIVTIAAGGTGLSLHDTTEGGKRPKSMVGVNMPWGSREMVQALGRLSRLGMTSKARIVWLVAPEMGVDVRASTQLAKRMRDQGLSTSGYVDPAVVAVKSMRDYSDIFGTGKWSEKAEEAEIVEEGVDDVAETKLETETEIEPTPEPTKEPVDELESARLAHENAKKEAVQDGHSSIVVQFEKMSNMHKDRNNRPSPYIVQMMDRLARRLAPQVKTRYQRWLDKTNPDGSPRFVGGHYEAAENLIVVAETLGPYTNNKKTNMIQTFGHEVLHYFRGQGMITEQEWKALAEEAIRTKAMDRYEIKARYPSLDFEGQLEETIAEMFGDYVNEREQSKMFSKMARDVFRRILVFLKAFAEKLKVFRPSSQDVMERMYYGMVGNRRQIPANVRPIKKTPEEKVVKESVAYAKGEEPYVQFSDPEVEKRYVEARKGTTRKGVWTRIAESLNHEKEKMTRHREHIPQDKKRGRVYASYLEKRRRREDAPDVAILKIKNNLHHITKGLDTKQFDLFTRSVIIDNLKWSAEQGMDLPFGFTSLEEVMAEKAKIDAMLESQPDVLAAIKRRDMVLEEMRSNLIRHNVLPPERLKNIRYFHHQVMEYANAKSLGIGTGQKLSTPQWAKREGSLKDINANYYEAEADWMFKAYVDIETMKFTKYLRHSKHNRVFAWRKKARANNDKRMYGELYQDIAEGLERLAVSNPNAGSLLKSFELIDGESPGAMTKRFTKALKTFKLQSAVEQSKHFKKLKQWRVYQYGIASSITTIRAVAANMPKEMQDQIPRRLAKSFNELVLSQGMDIYDAEYSMWPIIRWFSEQTDPKWGQFRAASMRLFKNVAQRKAFVRETVGEDKFVDPINTQRLVKEYGSEDWTVWQPDAKTGNERALHVFSAKTISEHVLDRAEDHIIEQLEQYYGTEQMSQVIRSPGGRQAEVPVNVAEMANLFAKVKDGMMLGGPKEEMILPKEMAKDLDNFRDHYSEAIFAKILDNGQRYWKIWTLFKPHGSVKYAINQVTGDEDAILSNFSATGTHKYFSRAARDLKQFMYKGELPSPMLKEAIERGVIPSALVLQEIPEHAIDMLEPSGKFKLDVMGKGKSKWNVPGRYFDTVMKALSFREGMWRYAAYLNYHNKLVEEGKTIEELAWGASAPWMLEGIREDDPDDIAAKMARDAMGDYGNISHHGRLIRKRMIPFWSWMETNTVRYRHMTGNAWAYAQMRGDDKALLKAAGTAARGAGLISLRGMFLGFGLTARILAFYSAVQLLSYMVGGEEEEDLIDPDGRQLRISLGVHGGYRYSFRMQGALSDSLGWLGMEDIGALINQYQRGHKTPVELAKDMALSAPNKLFGGISPYYKLPIEFLSEKNFYPDMLNPRQVHDQWDNAFRSFGLSGAYRYGMSKLGTDVTTKEEGALIRGLANIGGLYTQNVEEQKYWQIRSEVYKFKKKYLKQEERADLGYRLRMAQINKNEDKEKELRAKLRDAGVRNPRGLSHPLSGLPKQHWREFKRYLGPKGNEQVRNAFKYYQAVN